VDNRKRLIFNVDQFERILGNIAIICYDEGYRLTNIMDLVERERQLCTRLCQSGMRYKEWGRFEYLSEIRGGDY
jgi:hypothetical protein